MRTVLTIGLVLVGGVMGLPDLVAGADTEMSAEEKAAHDQLRALRAVAERAINENRLELLKPYLAENFSIVTYTDREFDDFDKFKKQWNITREKMLDGGSYTTHLNPKLSQLYGDIAVTRSNAENVLKTGSGEEYHFTSNWSATCRRVDGQWKIVRAHCSLNPFRNPMLEAGVKSMITKACLIAGVLGLIFGWLLKSVLNRRKKAATAA